MAAKRKAARRKTGTSWGSIRPAGKRSKGTGVRIGGKGRYLLALLVLAALVKWGVPRIATEVASHPVFTLRHVEVEGAEYLDEGEIMAVAAISDTVNVFDVDIAATVASLEASFAAEQFSVYRKLPDTIAIRVHERMPVALLNANGLIGVDAEGVPLPHIGAASIETLPIISGILTVQALADSATQAHLVSGLAFLDRLSKQAPSVHKRISEVNVGDVSRMGFTLVDNGLEVIVGDVGWEKTIPAIEGVIHRVTRQMETVRTVDLRFGEKIFVRKQ
jgi:cell division protein FtsQ